MKKFVVTNTLFFISKEEKKFHNFAIGVDVRKLLFFVDSEQKKARVFVSVNIFWLARSLCIHG
jgi:hypothetical protein